MIEIIPAVIPKDLHQLTERLSEYTNFTHDVHLDVNDGVFTRETSWPFGVGQILELDVMASHGGKLPKAEIVNYEVHLMVHEPMELGTQFIKAGARRLIAHAEAFEEAASLRATLERWREQGAHEVGIALLLHTPPAIIEEALPIASVVQFMSISVIGAHGAHFDEGVIPRIEAFHYAHPRMRISVDGGVSEKNIAALVRAGATRFCVGSALLKEFNSADSYAGLLQAAGEVQ